MAPSAPDIGGYVIRTRRGTRYTGEGFRALWQRTMRKAMKRGLLETRYTFHDLRAKSVSDSDPGNVRARRAHEHEHDARDLRPERSQGHAAEVVHGFCNRLCNWQQALGEMTALYKRLQLVVSVGIVILVGRVGIEPTTKRLRVLFRTTSVGSQTPLM
jgi:hypothetical protein